MRPRPAPHDRTVANAIAASVAAGTESDRRTGRSGLGRSAWVFKGAQVRRRAAYAAIACPGSVVDESSRRSLMMRSIRATGAIALTALVFPAGALAYASRQASRSEASAIVKDAKRTQPCGYNGNGHLSTFRLAQYAAKGVSFKWAETDWTMPGIDGCVLVFLHAGGNSFSSNQTPRHARVDWLPFTWGSSPFDNPSYLNQQWRQLGFRAGPPRWKALARAL